MMWQTIKQSKFFNVLIFLTIFLIGGGYAYYLFEQQWSLRAMIMRLEQDRVEHKTVAQPLVVPMQEKIVPKNQLWRTVQDQVKDTVVQIFAQRGEFDFVQPYRTPELYNVFGSGFFINADGDIVTNAHVVDQAKALWVQIPSLGKRIIDVSVIGVSPERDLALLRVSAEDLAFIRKTLGQVPFLPLGNSDAVRRADEVLALGYPLGQQSLKSTTGVISGRESHFIQMSAPINPGNSGGPLLNTDGHVVGINSAGITSAQNVGYIIPINDLKRALPDLYKIKLLRKPFLGVLFNNSTESLTQYLGNPQPGGCYVVEVVKNSTLFKAGVQPGDMLYEINGFRLDMYGEMIVPWSEDKITIVDYVSRLSIGENVQLVFYRNGKKKETVVKFSQAELPAVRPMYPAYEEIDYEVAAGMVVMPLTINHLQILGKNAPGLAVFTEIKNQAEPTLIITHIFPNSQLFRARVLTMASTLNEVNGVKVKTLEDFRAALKKSLTTGYLTIKASDNVGRLSDNIFVVLPFKKVLQEEAVLSRDYRYPISRTMQEMLKGFGEIKKTESYSA